MDEVMGRLTADGLVGELINQLKNDVNVSVINCCNTTARAYQQHTPIYFDLTLLMRDDDADSSCRLGQLNRVEL